MPKTSFRAKTSLVCTRVTPNIKKILEQQASREGLNPSEWLRSLIVKELKEENLLHTIYKTPRARIKE